MSTFKITLAYDGTDFVGWQRQAAGTSIQGLLENALGDLDGRHVPVVGAGRTDAGVHAIGQVASFSLDRRIDAATVVRAINARLPPDVRVLSAVDAPATFHARFDARSKTYRYRIWNGDVVSPFERRYVWHLAGALDVEAMARAARSLEGVHDFAAFQSAGGSRTKTERQIFALRIGECGLGIDCEVTGDGFLRHMVRAIVGTLAEVGQGRRTPEWVADVLASRDRTRAGSTAPASGLFLVSVGYDAIVAAES
jgi:tRNA pseudouridine38-40 synthase